MDSASRRVSIEPLDASAFAPFGDVLDAAGPPWSMINDGRCARHHDLARLEASAGGRLGISVFRSQPISLPYDLTLVERHPLGSQAFIPLSRAPFLVIVAPDLDGAPGWPRAFRTAPGQGVNYLRGVWHGVLTPLDAEQDFAVVDRIGAGDNLQEHRFASRYVIDD